VTLKLEIIHLFNIIPAPSEVYNDLNETPRWRMPLFFLLLLSPAIGLLNIPAAIEPLRKIYQENFDTQTADIALQTSTHYLTIIHLTFKPISSIFRWVVLSAVLLLITTKFSTKKQIKFNRIFSCVSYTEIIFYLMEIITILVIYIRGIDQIKNSSDMIVFKGINYFIDKNAIPDSIYTALNQINLFSLWYIATLARGIQIAGNIKYAKSIFLVSIAWCIWILLDLGKSFLIENILNLTF